MVLWLDPMVMIIGWYAVTIGRCIGYWIVFFLCDFKIERQVLGPMFVICDKCCAR